MLERLEKIRKRYNEINDLLVTDGIINNPKKMTDILKEQAGIQEIVDEYDKYLKVIRNISGTKEMLDDKEIGLIAKEELDKLEQEKEQIESELEILLLPKDPNDNKNVIVEIRGAAGGDEANIFAGDLYRMYTRYAESTGWKIEILNSIDGVSGGFSQIEFTIKGKNVYKILKYESGAHRVQRVPTTEAQGRIHTSTATVLVMPEVEDIDIEVKESDLRIDVYRSGGAGGQSVNTTDSAVRITHVPTGIVVSCQNERSQIKNKEKAMRILKAKLYDEKLRKQEEELGKERRMKIGTGDRSEKIRTYNYPQNRITDHRISYTTMNLDRVMEGNIGELLETLVMENKNKQLESK